MRSTTILRNAARTPLIKFLGKRTTPSETIFHFPLSRARSLSFRSSENCQLILNYSLRWPHSPRASCISLAKPPRLVRYLPSQGTTAWPAERAQPRWLSSVRCNRRHSRCHAGPCWASQRRVLWSSGTSFALPSFALDRVGDWSHWDWRCQSLQLDSCLIRGLWSTIAHRLGSRTCDDDFLFTLQYKARYGHMTRLRWWYPTMKAFLKWMDNRAWDDSGIWLNCAFSPFS